MNPLLFQAHPLLYLTVDLPVNPASHTPQDAATLILIYLSINLIWSGGLLVAVNKAVGFTLPYPFAYLMAFWKVI